MVVRVTRISRNRAKRVMKRRKHFPFNRFGTDGPKCPYCCKMNGRFRRETLRGREDLREMREYETRA